MNIDKMTSIVFDFSSSPVGGGLKRLNSYISYFRDWQNVFFLVPDVFNSTDISSQRIFKIKKSSFQKLMNFESYKIEIKKKIGHIDIWFSYGIPLNTRICNVQVLHISNALSLKTKGISLKFLDRARFNLLKYYFKRSVKFVDLWTCESKFTMSLLSSFNFDPLKIYISPNGLDSFQSIICSAEISVDRYFVAIGTYSYKRLDLLISWFKKNASLPNDCRLKIVGAIQKDTVIECSSVDWLGALPQDQVLMYLSNSIGYISFSEIENSSNALAEAALFQKKLVLSNIPSHTEFLDQNQIKYIVNNNILETTELYHFNRSNIDWVDVNTKLLDRFKLL